MHTILLEVEVEGLLREAAARLRRWFLLIVVVLIEVYVLRDLDEEVVESIELGDEVVLSIELDEEVVLFSELEVHGQVVVRHKIVLGLEVGELLLVVVRVGRAWMDGPGAGSVAPSFASSSSVSSSSIASRVKALRGGMKSASCRVDFTVRGSSTARQPNQVDSALAESPPSMSASFAPGPPWLGQFALICPGLPHLKHGRSANATRGNLQSLVS